MVSASSRIAATDALARLAAKPASTTNKTDSFAQQLTGAIKGQVAPPRIASPAGSRVGEAARQNTGGSQLLVAGRDAATELDATAEIPTMLGMGPAAGTPPVATRTRSASDSPTMLGMGPVARVAAGSTALLSTSTSGIAATAAKVPVANPKTATPQAVASSTPTETEADAYWAQQPAAVQVLRGMPDDEAKEKLALNLANQGYTIDTQIMVWNWDPQMTMQVRENQGYSWVPSFGQSNVPIGPGLSMPGAPNSYNPASPPAGSIKVSTSFDVGTILNPLVQVDQTTT